MVRILLCDDNPVFLERVREMIRNTLASRKLDGAIHAFTAPGEIPEALLADCGIFFLDMDFPSEQETGLTLAGKIRQINRDAVIVFLTNYIEYAPAGYKVQAFRYLLKSDVDSSLEETLWEAVGQLETKKETVQLSVSGESVTLFLEDILYLEAQAHTVVVHTRGQEAHRVYSSLASLEQQIGSRGFLRIQKSYLVNMRRIQRLRFDYVTLDDGTQLPVSKTGYAEQKRKYMLWKGQT